VDGKGGTGKGTYRTLAAAVLEAGRGDIILLRVDGELKLEPVLLNKAPLSDLTIRAADGFRPVLTLTESGEIDAALFRVHDGRLRLENLEVRLRPEREGFDVQALVAFVGDGECVLDNCLVTLDRAGQKTSLAVAVLLGPGTQMKVTMPSDRPRDKGPRFALDRCLVRGEGDLVWSRSGRPAEVDVKNSLVALSGGSVVNVEAGNPMPEAPVGTLALRLTRVTAYLTGNLLRVVAGKELRDLARLKCEVSECLLLPAGGARALVHLEGAEADETTLLEKLAWEGGRNGYGGFGTMLELQTGGVTMRMPSPLTLDKWKDYSAESDSEYGVKPAGLPAADTPFTQLVPSSFKVGDERPKGSGADLARLPAPGKERTEKK
jgi:hypothetical protein